MCWKKLFGKPDPVVYSDRVALLFGINDYPGSSNDLDFCINDIKDAAKKITEYDFQVRQFGDDEVIKSRFKKELADAIEAMPEGATVVIFADSCHSESNTRNPVKPRFYDPGLKIRKKRWLRHAFRTSTMKWLAFSGCEDDQYSSEAMINGRGNGIFTYYALRCMEPGITYQELFDRIRTYLPNDKFEQRPTLEGPTGLRGRKLFEGPTLVLWYSGHGSYVKDYSGDEEDGLDETIFLVDGHLIDDELNKILMTIK